MTLDFILGIREYFFQKDDLPKSVKWKDCYCTVPEDATDKI